MRNKSRLGWVDMAKGISIILVVMMHTAYGVGEDTGNVSILHWIIGFATPFRMPEFFLISGLFLSAVIARPWARYADRRVVHYLYFYGLWAAILIAVKIGLFGAGPGAALFTLGQSVWDPYSVLWFIYMLAVFSLVAKLAFEARIPHWVMLGLAAILQILPVHTGLYAVDYFASYLIYFYIGYALAPAVFRVAAYASDKPRLAALGLIAFALIEAALVFSPGFEISAERVQLGLAGLPVVNLALGISGALAVCVTAVLLDKSSLFGWLRWLGAHSIVIYLAFSIPMAASRLILLRTGIVTDASAISLIVLFTAIVSPVILYLAIQRTGLGRFLFERPDWAYIPGTRTVEKPAKHNHVPAE